MKTTYSDPSSGVATLYSSLLGTRSAQDALKEPYRMQSCSFILGSFLIVLFYRPADQKPLTYLHSTEHNLSHPFFKTYVQLSPSYITDFSLHD